MKTSNYSTVLTVTTDPLSLDTPILDAMGTITYNSAVINWLPVDNAQGYKVYLENTDDTLVILDDLDISNVLTYTLTGLYQNTNYQYKVKAYYNLLESAYSVADDFVTTDFVILAPVIGANTGLTFDSVRINWTKRSNATSYKIYLENTDTTTVIINGVDIGDIDTYLFDGLDSSSNYLWKIKSYNSVVNEESTYSSNQTFTTLDPIPDVPTMSSSTSVTYNSFVANWSSETYADSYNVYVYTDIDLTNLFVSYTGVLTNSKSVTGLTELTDYYTVVESVNESGVSAKTSYILTTTFEQDLQIDSYTKTALKFKNNYEDETINNNDAIPINAPTFTTALLTGDTNSLLLDGVNDVLELPNAISTNRTITVRALFSYNSFTRANTYLYSEWYGEALNTNYLGKIIMEYDKTNNRFIIWLYDDGYGATPNNTLYLTLVTSTINLSVSQKVLMQFSWDNTSKTAKFYMNNSEYTLTLANIALPYGILTTSTLNLNDSISPRKIYWGGFTYPNTLEASLSPNQVLSRLYIDDGIARDASYHSQDWSNISSRL